MSRIMCGLVFDTIPMYILFLYIYLHLNSCSYYISHMTVTYLLTLVNKYPSTVIQILNKNHCKLLKLKSFKCIYFSL